MDDVNRVLIKSRLLLRNVNKEYMKQGASPQFYILSVNEALLVNWYINDRGQSEPYHHSTACDGNILHDSPASLLIEDRDREKKPSRNRCDEFSLPQIQECPSQICVCTGSIDGTHEID